MLNTENIQSLIDSGEGYNVEFKVRVPSKVRELTEEVCAFANADGGYLLIGVDDNGQVVDTNLENDKRSAIQGSISEISPALHCELYSVNVGNKTVWVIDVPSGKDKPYIFSGSIYVREGANSQKLRTAEEMRSFFQECNKIFFRERDRFRYMILELHFPFREEVFQTVISARIHEIRLNPFAVFQGNDVAY